jgi:hypothetical protein
VFRIVAGSAFTILYTLSSLPLEKPLCLFVFPHRGAIVQPYRS